MPRQLRFRGTAVEFCLGPIPIMRSRHMTYFLYRFFYIDSCCTVRRGTAVTAKYNIMVMIDKDKTQPDFMLQPDYYTAILCITVQLRY